MNIFVTGSNGQLGNEIYITGFRINNETGKPNSNGNIYKITTCEEKNRYCINKLKGAKEMTLKRAG